MDCLNCIPRDDMPQVDMIDLSALLVFLNEQYGIHTERRTIPTDLLRHKQCPDHFDPVQGKELETKPLLVASDCFILDGNHRHCGARAAKLSVCDCYQLTVPFDQAVQAILHYAKAYHYGDGAVHPMGVY